jgi:small conductance mechanosensitive channel
MADMSTALSSTSQWLSENAVGLLIVAGLLLFLYRGLKPLVRRILVRVMQAQQSAAADDPGHQAEVDRRVATIEDLITKLLRTAVIVAIVAVILGLLNLWPALAGFGLLIAALTLAGQSIILDVLMGTLILVEAQYFKGDTVRIGQVEGVVEEVGIRRTQVRDIRGTLHSISNGLIRESANLTRTYATATVEIDGVADRDVEAVIEVLDTVGQELAADPDFAEMFGSNEPPKYAGTIRLTAAGSTLRLSGRVRPEFRTRIEAEMRRRVAGGLAARGITLIVAPIVPIAPAPTR